MNQDDKDLNVNAAWGRLVVKIIEMMDQDTEINHYRKF